MDSAEVLITVAIGLVFWGIPLALAYVLGRFNGWARAWTKRDELDEGVKKRVEELERRLPVED